MKPYIHAQNSARKWGGAPEDYLDIHNFLDCSKAAHPDMRHRAILHSSLGCFIAERLYGVPERALAAAAERFGWTDEEQDAVLELLRLARTDATTSLRNSDGTRVEVRDIAEHHILEDMGRIPTVSDYLDGMPMYDWLGGPKRTTRTIPLRD